MAEQVGARRTIWIGVAALAIVALVLLLWPGREPSKPTSPVVGSASTSGAPAVATADKVVAPTPFTAAPDGSAPEPPKTIWQLRLNRAQQTLDKYLESTRYPPHSRPISEMPDLQTTERRVEKQLGFRKKNGTKRGDLRLNLTQSSQRIIADETLRMTIACVSGKGIEPSTVLSARSEELPSRGQTQTPIAFVDDGSHGDEKAGDQVWTALFQPATSAQFNGYNGDVQVPVEIRCSGDEALTYFNFFYTANVPARFTGKVREAVEKGSLALYLELEVKKAGWYKLDLRVDDANDTRLAFTSFDAELPVGLHEARFVLFGKLIVDYAAQPPFKLRDLDGYRFVADTSPDREYLKPTAGPIYTTKTYPAGTFSDAEWTSEEKDRNVAEFTKDVKEAKEKVADEQSGKIPKEYPPSSAPPK
ncbi:MAG: hypothetical protein HYV09_01200 [Deltaproteobacteria bacterium]|nr:hypothetical protein [Deltaproteobacteria bacterium]